MPSRSVLAVNSGSSSLKFALFTLSDEPAPLVRGTAAITDPAAAVEFVLANVASSLKAAPLAGIGHRMVHGGDSAMLVSDAVLQKVRDVIAFAPNHLPQSLALVEECGRVRPDVRQLLCFDTAFHASLPELARRLPIPREYDERGVRRYGFHGLSYTFLMNDLRRTSPDLADGRLVLAHLGSGSSLSAVRAGTPVDTSMAFTPLSGVVMSTRPGDLDPGVVTYLAGEVGGDLARADRVLSRESGLAAIAETSGDMRELLEREERDPRCRLAVAIYCYEIKKRIGAYAAALGGLDGLVFSGGIGERAPAVRRHICDGLSFLGIEIDAERNDANARTISRATARVAVHVIPSDEESVIARSAFELLG